MYYLDGEMIISLNDCESDIRFKMRSKLKLWSDMKNIFVTLTNKKEFEKWFNMRNKVHVDKYFIMPIQLFSIVVHTHSMSDIFYKLVYLF